MVHRDKLLQPPKGYHLVATFKYPTQYVFFTRVLPIVCSVGVYLLGSRGILHQGIFRTVASLGNGVGAIAFMCIVGISSDIIRGLIQRGVNHLLGYDISLSDLVFSPLESIFSAAPGQFQKRRDALLVAITPLTLFLLLWIPLLFGLSGVIGGALAFFLIVNTLAAMWDLYFVCWLLSKPKGTLLLIESVLKLGILEPKTQGVADHQVKKGRERRKKKRALFTRK